MQYEVTNRKIRVLIIDDSALIERGSATALRALELGTVDLLARPKFG